MISTSHENLPQYDNLDPGASSESDIKLKKAESDAYTEIFDSASGQTFQQIDDTVLALANGASK